MRILVLEDKLGITSAYLSAWEDLTRQAGFTQLDFFRYSAWKSPVLGRLKLLHKVGNRKSLGFNPDERVQRLVKQWFEHTVKETNADAVLCMDVALLGIFEQSWDIATIDRLRGGVYHMTIKVTNRPTRQIPILITVPISAINNRKKTKDIKAVNDGAENQEEWEEMDHDPEELFYEPYTIPFGRWVLTRDLKKLKQLVGR